MQPGGLTAYAVVHFVEPILRITVCPLGLEDFQAVASSIPRYDADFNKG
jgi:hypothetical protein